MRIADGEPSSPSTAGGDAEPARHGRRRLPRRRRIILLCAGAVGVLVVAFAVTLVVQVLSVRSDLAHVPDELSAAQEQVLDGDTASAKSTVGRIRGSTRHARTHSAGPVWWLASKLPVAGTSLGTSRSLIITLDDLARGPLTALTGVATTLNPDTVVNDGVVDVDAVVRARPAILRAASDVELANRRVGALPHDGLLGPVRDARDEAGTKLDKLATLLNDAAEVVRIGPGMLGAEGRRTYFLAFQNNAEIKATGGLIGVYGVLTADHGKVSLDQTAPNDTLVNFKLPVLDLGPEYSANYGYLFPQSLWSNANSSPHFPYAAQTWATMYEKQFGTHVDGVIAVDPEMVADLLRATGPVRVADGQEAKADNVARLVEVDAYAEFDTDERAARKNFLRDVADAAFHAGLSGDTSPRKLVDSFTDAAKAGHIQVWSRSSEEMEGLRDAHVTGEIYQGAAPYAGVVLNNVSGAKLDYYLDRDVVFAFGSCEAGRRHGHIEITLTNQAPPNLPRFVTDRIDAPRGTYPVGQSRLQLSVYLTSGAKAINVALNGKPVEFTTGTELGHPRLQMWVYPTPGQSLTVTVDTDEPVSSQKPLVPVQPMARPMSVEIGQPSC